MMRSLILIFLLYLPSQIFAQPNETDFTKYFSESEIDDLELITDFFQKEFCGSTDRKDFERCIPNLNLSLSYQEGKALLKRISWKRQQKLYSKISESTFNKIWSICKAWILEPVSYEYPQICFSMNNDFIDFVNYLAISNPALEGYGTKLENIGFSPIVDILYSIQNYPHQTNLNDRGIQILLAIHFLTENDRMNRDKKAMRLEQRHYHNLMRNK